MNEQSSATVHRAIRLSRTVHLAIVLGTLAFGAAVFVIHNEQWVEDLAMSEVGPILTYAAAAMGAVMVPTAFAMRAAVGRRVAVAQSTRAKLEGYRAGVILFAAMIEGATLFNLVACVVGDDPILNGIIALFLWVILVAATPTQTQFEHFAGAETELR